MKKELENLKREIDFNKNIIESRESLEKKKINDRIYNDKLILENNEVRELFEEIRDNNVLRYDSNTPAKVEFTYYQNYGKFSNFPKGEKIPTYSIKFDGSSYLDYGDQYSQIQVGVYDGGMFIMGAKESKHCDDWGMIRVDKDTLLPKLIDKIREIKKQ